MRVALVRESTVRVKVEGTDNVVEVARRLIGDLDRETFLVLCLDTKLPVNAAYVAAVGSLDHCPLHPREVFKAALPSGDPWPSPDDRAVTRRLCEASEILGIPVRVRPRPTASPGWWPCGRCWALWPPPAGRGCRNWSPRGRHDPRSAYRAHVCRTDRARGATTP